MKKQSFNSFIMQNLATTLGPKYYKLRDILNEDQRWATLLEALPYDDCNELERVAKDAEQRPWTSPAEVLLYRLSCKGATIEMIKAWLTEIGLDKALYILQDEVPLKIVEQPEPYRKIQEDQELVLTFLTESVPEPEYQWFKDNETNELKGQNYPTLQIPHAQLEDTGVYVCRAHTFYSNGECDHCISQFSIVEVVTSDVEALPSVPGACMHMLDQSSSSLLDNMKKVKVVNDLQVCNRWCESSMKTDITDDSEKDIDDLQIIKQPVSPGSINQGATVVLDCHAQSSLPICYQWYCNGKKMPDETSHELKLSNLYLDTYTGEDYYCEVSTKAQRLTSCSVSFQLNRADNSVRYYATDKTALLIANNIYKDLDDLKSPPNDVATLSRKLKSIGFKVIVLMNLDLMEMRKAVHVFCESLKKGSYGLVYYAGHGFEQYGQSYFQPIDASESCYPHECVCVEEVLEAMQEKDPAMSLLLIDMCRRLPKTFNDGEVLQPGKIYEPRMKRNVVCGYATSFQYAAYESNKSPHGCFMKYLQEHITKNESIEYILWKVKCDFANDKLVHKLQYPWVGSSLTAPRKLTDPVTTDTPATVTKDTSVTWVELQSPPFPNMEVRLPSLGISFVLEFHAHKEEFCNAADLYLYLETENITTCASPFQFDVDFWFNLSNIFHNVVPLESNNNNNSRLCLCKVEIFDLQRIESGFTGTLNIKCHQTGDEIARIETIPFKQPPVSKLKCAQFHQRLHNIRNDEASHGLMKLQCYVQNHYNESCEDVDLISFSGEITSSDSDKTDSERSTYAIR